MTQTVVATAVDERFRVRGPYWRPGDSVLAEPWVALAETNTGHLMVPCGRNRQHALDTVARWRALAERDMQVDPHRVVVGAAVVDPRGEVVESWGSVPVPGGEPRWVTLHRLMTPQTCACGSERPPGAWVTRGSDGCVECLPEREAHDPRPWPVEFTGYGAVEPVKRKTTGGKKKTSRKAAPIVSPDQGRLE